MVQTNHERSPKTHLFKNALQTGDFWKRRLFVYMWTDENGGFRIDDVIHHILLAWRMLSRGSYRISIVVAFSCGRAKMIRICYVWMRFFWTFLSGRCTTTTWDWLISRFVEGGKTRQQLPFSFPELWHTLLEFNSRKICQHLTHWTSWNYRDKVCSATSLLKWRFRSRHRHCCLNSLLCRHNRDLTKASNG